MLITKHLQDRVILNDKKCMLKYSRLDSLVIKEGKRVYWDTGVELEYYPKTVLQPEPSETVDQKFKNTEYKFCLLCKRKFQFLETLERHFVESKLHLNNLKRWNEWEMREENDQTTVSMPDQRSLSNIAKPAVKWNLSKSSSSFGATSNSKGIKRPRVDLGGDDDEVSN